MTIGNLQSPPGARAAPARATYPFSHSPSRLGSQKRTSQSGATAPVEAKTLARDSQLSLGDFRIKASCGEPPADAEAAAAAVERPAVALPPVAAADMNPSTSLERFAAVPALLPAAADVVACAEQERPAAAPLPPPAEQPQANSQLEQHPGVTALLMARPDGTVKLLLIDGAPPAGSHEGLLERKATPYPGDIPVPAAPAPLSEVPLTDGAGGAAAPKSVLARFFARERQADDNKRLSPQAVNNVQAPKPRRSFSAQMARSFKNLGRSIRRSIKRKDSPPIPLGRHLIANRRTRCGATLESVAEQPEEEGQGPGAEEEERGQAQQLHAVAAGGPSAGCESAFSAVAVQGSAVSAGLAAAEAPALPVSVARFPPPPSAVHELLEGSSSVIGEAPEPVAPAANGGRPAGGRAPRAERARLACFAACMHPEVD